ncbi:sensor histidine kinase [Actinoallomurus bryophytorum]|uniref:histidine kinase n=1 Tax=Actinoallomurus bryophytorum TaxID=1490222 RepID=A0A543CQM8_9ACTN|nr:histidine kinase [Actinoallomurus bryophytorum]TQL99389.1 signal transduction histidine kinase [Actinoallomurus bryophytorum]
MTRFVRHGAGGVRLAVGVALGALTSTAELVFLLLTGPVLLVRRTPPHFVTAAARRLVRIERTRLTALLGAGENGEAGDRRVLAYLAVRWPVGLLGGGVLFLLLYGAVTTVAVLAGWLYGGRPDGIAPTWPILVYLFAAATVLLFLDLAGLAAVAAFERGLVRRFLGPDERALMRARIAELSASRAGIVAAVDAERRRIERDLHDGLQQRLVALGMLLGRARRNESRDLLRQAHEESRRALEELRDIAWRVYPAALDDLGLRDALATVAERCAVPVRVHCDLPDRPIKQVETAAYFTVREAVTNAAKHSGATLIDVSILRRGTLVIVMITDDGAGGADPGGGGLSGLARRVAALDGRFRVSSPAGGPTVVTAELPCA